MEIVIKFILVLALLILVLGFISYVNGGPKLYVAIILPHLDRSGKTDLVGVFRKKETAESAIYQLNHGSGYERPSIVIECVINKRIPDD